MASNDHEVRMMMSVYPGAMTGFAAMNAGLSSILNVFNGMTRAFDQQFGLVDAALTTTSVVVTQLGVDAMNAFGQFEQGMKIVQMVSGQTASDMDYLKQKANEFSVEYRTDIDQITEGLQTLGRAGLNTASEQAEVLENGLTTAKLEGRDLNSVLQELIQNTALLGGNLKSSEFGEDSQYVNDLLVATSMTAPITTHDISETLKYSGGIAAAAGAKIRTDTGEINEEGKRILEDYMGTIAAFAQKGVSGSIAGTALRAFMNKPATQDSSVTDALASIKLKPEYLWEEGEETMKPISEQIGLIQAQMDKLNVSTMDRLQIWSKIVGGKMGQQMMKLDSEDIKDITKDIQAADNASNLAAGSMKTYEANIKMAKESGAELQREVGEKLVWFANPWVEIGNKILDFLSMDFMSTPLALGVITFVGYLFTQIRRVASTIRSEISSLLGLTKDARTLIHQSMTGRAQMDKEKVGSFIAMKEDSSKQATQIAKAEAGQAAAEGFKAFNTQYNKQLAAVSKLSYGALVDAGVTGDRMGVVAALQTIKKTDSFGLRPQDYIAAGMVTGTLPKGMEEELIKARKGGLTGRSLVDTVIGKDGSKELNAFMAHIRASSENLKLLGISAEQAAAKMNGTSDSGKSRYGSLHDSGKQVRTMGFVENRIALQEATAAEEKKVIVDKENIATTQQQIGTAQAQATALKQSIAAQNEVVLQVKSTNNTIKEDVVIAQEEILSTVQVGSSEVASAVSIAMDEIKMKANAVTPGSYPGRWNIPSNPMITETGGVNPGLLVGGIAGQAYVNAMNQADALLNRIKSEGGFPLPFPKNTNTTPTMNLSYISGIGDPGFVSGPNQVLLLPPGKPTPTPIVGGVGVGSLPGLATQIQAEIEKNMLVPRSGAENVKLGSGIEAEKELMIEEQNLAVLEQIFRELLNIANRITKTRMVQDLRESTATADENATARLHNHQATQQAIDNAKAANKFIEKNTYDQKEYIKAKRALSEAGTGYPTRMNTSSSDQVVPSNFAKGYVNQQQANVDNIKKGIESSSVSAKLTNTVNTLSRQNQGSSSAYMSNIRDAQINFASAIASQKEADRIKTQKNAFIRDLNEGYTSPKHYNIGQQGLSIVGPYSLLDMKAMEDSVAKGNIKSQQSPGFWASVAGRWGADRTGRINFGQTAKGIRGFANGLLNMTDLIGGPVMLAFMAIPAAIDIWKGEFEKFTTSLKDAGDKLNEAYSNWQTAEDELEQTYREGNPDATDDEIKQMILDTYATMGEDMANAVNNGSEEWFKKLNLETNTGPEYEYDEEKNDGTVKEKEPEKLSAEEEYTNAVKANTGALYAATAELNRSLDNYTRKATDSWWGLDGWVSKLSDNWLNMILSPFVIGLLNPQKVLQGKFSDNNEFLLTQSQKDENYAGYTEMAGLMMEDFKDAGGNWIKGMRTMMGSDVEDMAHMFSSDTDTYKYLQDLAHFSAGKGQGGLTSQQNAKLQASMKNDTKTWKQLAKELSKRDSAKKAGKSIETQEKKIAGLINKLNGTVGNNFSKTQILQAAYIMQLQDMYAIAQQAIVPIMQQNMQTAMSTLSVAGQVDSNTGATISTTDGTYQNAAIIAGLVAIIAKAQAKTVYFDTAVGGSTTPGHITDVTGDGVGDDKDVYWINKAREGGMDADKFYAEFSKTYDEAAMSRKNIGGFGGLNPIWEWQSKGFYKDNDLLQEGALGYIRLFEATAKMEGYDYSPERAAVAARNYANYVKENGISLNDAIKTAEKNYTLSDSFKQKIVDAYNMSGDEGAGSGSGGSGSGSGSNKDKDTGTKKERVDLVLCNKKEIPKLNVNLFKKAPSFTILNKNFKLRDIKVNTQDKPKAVLASIKNAIIDVQKRTDPKIIQDEEAIYDPVGATDGNTPSGTSDVKTNSN